MDDRTQRYKEAAALLRSWINDPGDGDEKASRALEPYLERLDQAGKYGRGRYIPCRGCPTIECTCFTELEDHMLKNAPTTQDSE